MEERLDYPYPDKLLDKDGYPTEAALLYIRNWSMVHENGQAMFGKFWGTDTNQELIDYVKSIYTYDDAISQEDGLLEIHTLGWSGNEDIIRELKNTTLWLMKHVATQTGGHYYFRLDRDSKYTYSVEKTEARW